MGSWFRAGLSLGLKATKAPSQGQRLACESLGPRAWRFFQSMRNRPEPKASEELPIGTTERTSDNPPLAGPAAGCGEPLCPETSARLEVLTCANGLRRHPPPSEQRHATHKRPMISHFQTAILAVLPNKDEEGVPPREIFRRLGVERPTRSQRASLSRALSRLAAQRLIVGLRENIESRHHRWRRRQ